MTSGKIEIRALSLEPLHHGAGTSGNTQILRRQEIVDQSGQLVRVPFVSGNSLKHMIRHGAALHALETMGVQANCLSKPVVDLLFSGGALTRAGSSAVQLGRARELSRLFPMLGLLGYGAGNTLVESKLTVNHLHLVCAENAGRNPDDVHPGLATRRAGFFLSDDFGTRHDVARSTAGQRWLAGEAQEARAAELSQREQAKTAKDARGESSQMIYNFQTVRAGARWWGALRFDGCSDAEMMALRAGLSRSCEGSHPAGMLYRFGAKGAIGFGLMAIDFRGYRLEIQQPQYSTDASIVSGGSADPVWLAYVDNLKANADEILRALEEVAA